MGRRAPPSSLDGLFEDQTAWNLFLQYNRWTTEMHPGLQSLMREKKEAITATVFRNRHEILDGWSFRMNTIRRQFASHSSGDEV